MLKVEQNNLMDLAANEGHFFPPVYKLPGMLLRIKLALMNFEV